MEHYDEDLYENLFFQTLQRKYSELYDLVTSKRWIILVPRIAALGGLQLTIEDLENHILKSTDDQPTMFRTANNKEVLIMSNTITTGKGFSKVKTAHILFEETYFNKNDESYRVICINQPLEGGLDMSDEIDGSATKPVSISLNSMEDCCHLLWGKTRNHRTRGHLKNLVDQLLKTLNKHQPEFYLDRIKDDVQSTFDKAVKVALKDSEIKKYVASSPEAAMNINRAVETYVVQSVYRPLFRLVCTCVAAQDAKLNKITRNLTNLHLSHLNIPSVFCNYLPRIRMELSYMSRLLTPSEKLNCLKRVMLSLMNAQMSDDSGQPVPVTSDDLLPVLMYLIVRTELTNWWAQFTFMKDFHVKSSTRDQEFEFYLTSIEASLVHVTSGQLGVKISSLEKIDFVYSPMSNSTVESPATINLISLLSEFFQKVSENNVEAVQKILSDFDSHHKKPNGVKKTLCHPLCSCNDCIGAGEVPSSFSGLRIPNSLVAVNVTTDNGFTALHVAALYGHQEMAELLIQKGADVNALDHVGFTPLHIAAQNGNQAVMILLLSHDADISLVDKNKNTTLHWASLNGHDDCVKALIFINQTIRKLSLNAQNDHMESALHLAAKWGYEGILVCLLENGASPNIRNRKNQVPMDLTQNLKMVDRLSRAVAEKNELIHCYSVQQKTTKSPLNRDVRSNSMADETRHRNISNEEVKSSVNSSGLPQPKSKSRPASSGNDREVEKLLKAVADGDIQMVKHLLNWLEFESDHPEIKDVDITKVKLCHPLCQCEHCVLAQKLMERTPSNLHVNCRNAEGFTPLHVACLHGHYDIVDMLIRRGANVNACTNSHGVACLHLACKQKNVKVVKCLVDYKANIGVCDDAGNTPLHYCSLCSSLPHACFLIESGANVNCVNKKGNSALHDAIRSNSIPLVALLIQNGADAMLENGQQLIPMHCVGTVEMRQCIRVASTQELHFRKIKAFRSFCMDRLEICSQEGVANAKRTFLKRTTSLENIPDNIERRCATLISRTDDTRIASWDEIYRCSSRLAT